MARPLLKLTACVLASAGALTAHAFVTPSAPAGFGGTGGAWTYTPPTAQQQLASIMRGPGPSIAGAGQTSAAYRLGMGAARVLARASVAGLAIGGAVWLAQNCFEKQGTQWMRTCGTGGVPPPTSDGYEYSTDSSGQPWLKTKQGACDQALSRQIGLMPSVNWTHAVPKAGLECWVYGTLKSNGAPYNGTGYTGWNLSRRTATNCPAGWYVTPAGCVQQRPAEQVTPQEVEDEMAPKPLPSTLPPGVPYPIELPWFMPIPGDNPQSQPLRVPQGIPQPIPNTDPQQYRQPVTRWTHSPTQAEPWRMDVQPEDVISTSPTGIVAPEPVGSGSPQGSEPEQFDLCKEHPDILACQKMGTLEPNPVGNEERVLAITPKSGWGPSTAGCPAPKSMSLSFGPIQFEYTLLCQFVNGIRPVVIAMAWLTAAFTFFGLGRRNE